MLDFSLLPHVSLETGWVNLHRWAPGRIDERKQVYPDPFPLFHCAVWLVRSEGIEVSELSPQGSVRRTWHLKPGSIFIWPMDAFRRISTPHGGEWISIGMMAHLFKRVDLFKLLNAPREIQLEEEQLALAEGCFRQLLVLTHGAQPPAMDQEQARSQSHSMYVRARQAPQTAFTRWTAQALAETIFGLCWMACADRREMQLIEQEVPVWLMQVLSEINRQPQMKVTEMAAMAGFSDAQFRRLFARWMGQPPQEYLHTHRLESARHLLETTDLAISEIARRIGFSSASHFARIFRLTFGNTPEQYRRGILQAHF